MSKDVTVELLTPNAAEKDVLTVRGDDLERLAAALRAASSSSEPAARLSAAVEEALAGNGTIVIGVASGGQGDERETIQEKLDRLIETMTPDVRFPSEAAALLSQRNARRRAELLEEFGALTGEQIARERSRARNRHALAARWRKEGRLFGVPYRGQTLYPAFQFDDANELRPVVGQVLEALPRPQMSDWELALWWTAANGHLGGRRPVDLLDEDPDALPTAARDLARRAPL
jgi:hypothetical protein